MQNMHSKYQCGIYCKMNCSKLHDQEFQISAVMGSDVYQMIRLFLASDDMYIVALLSIIVLNKSDQMT